MSYTATKQGYLSMQNNNVRITIVLLLFLCSNDSRTIDGNEFLDDQNYSDNNLWINELALLLFTVSFLTLAYLVLRLSKKEK